MTHLTFSCVLLFLSDMICGVNWILPIRVGADCEIVSIVLNTDLMCNGKMHFRKENMADKKRCGWCNTSNPKYIEYHDKEWGIPNFEDGYLYEMLILEMFQAGLSWECVLNKRESFRAAFDGFDINTVCQYGEAKIAQLMSDKGIIRNRRKIQAGIDNSRIFKDITEEFGSFNQYLKSFTDGKIIVEVGKTTNALSDTISRDLQKRGMKFVGSTIIYSYLQAVGVIYSHEEGCYLHKD